MLLQRYFVFIETTRPSKHILFLLKRQDLRNVVQVEIISLFHTSQLLNYPTLVPFLSLTMGVTPTTPPYLCMHLVHGYDLRALASTTELCILSYALQNFVSLTMHSTSKTNEAGTCCFATISLVLISLDPNTKE